MRKLLCVIAFLGVPALLGVLFIGAPAKCEEPAQAASSSGQSATPADPHARLNKKDGWYKYCRPYLEQLDPRDDLDLVPYVRHGRPRDDLQGGHPGDDGR